MTVDHPEPETSFGYVRETSAEGLFTTLLERREQTHHTIQHHEAILAGLNNTIRETWRWGQECRIPELQPYTLLSRRLEAAVGPLIDPTYLRTASPLPSANIQAVNNSSEASSMPTHSFRQLSSDPALKPAIMLPQQISDIGATVNLSTSTIDTPNARDSLRITADAPFTNEAVQYANDPPLEYEFTEFVRLPDEIGTDNQNASLESDTCVPVALAPHTRDSYKCKSPRSGGNN